MAITSKLRIFKHFRCNVLLLKLVYSFRKTLYMAIKVHELGLVLMIAQILVKGE